MKKKLRHLKQVTLIFLGKLLRPVAVGQERGAILVTQSQSNYDTSINILLLAFFLRAELTAVQSSVLQQELDSCRLLLEEEPNNKCKCNLSPRTCCRYFFQGSYSTTLVLFTEYF